MGITNTGKSGIALLLTASGIRPDVIAIGSGSGAFAVTNTNLVAETRSVAFTTTDISTAQQVTFTADFNSTVISGTILREFGLKKSGLSNTVFNREAFGSIAFDGTNELQIQMTVKLF